MDASVIVPSYLSIPAINYCLDSLSVQKTGYNYEVIVVDSSPPGYINPVRENFPFVKFIELKKRTYPGIARNIGAAGSIAELLIFIDSDIITPKDLINRAVEYYKSGHNVFSGSVDIWYNKKICILEKIELYFEFSEYKPNMPEAKKRCLPGCLLAVKREIFKKDNFLDLVSSEDTEFTVRLAQKGDSLYFKPDLKVFHSFKTSLRSLTKKALGFGFSNMQVRRIRGSFGSRMLKFKALSCLAVPFFALLKFIKLTWRNLKFNSCSDKLLYLLFLPLILVLVAVWMIGSYQGLFIKLPDYD